MNAQSLIGLIVVVLGVLLLLSTLGLAGVGYVIKAVPSLFIAYGVWQLVSGRGRRPFGPVLIIVVAVFVQLLVLDISIGSLWPLILIIIGIAIIFGQRGLRGTDERTSDDVDKLNTLGILGSTKRRLTSQTFKGGQVTAVLGEVEIDLRGAALEDPSATLEVTSVLGEVKLKVSPEWAVDIDAVTVLGDAVEDRHTVQGARESQPTLIITGLVLLGSLKITD
ncbi:MAG: LiaF-related protein [Chloroflexi bacterium]|nr:LiaF-related protein [Chloroflexota bacterium]